MSTMVRLSSRSIFSACWRSAAGPLTPTCFAESEKPRSMILGSTANAAIIKTPIAVPKMNGRERTRRMNSAPKTIPKSVNTLGRLRNRATIDFLERRFEWLEACHRCYRNELAKQRREIGPARHGRAQLAVRRRQNVCIVQCRENVAKPLIVGLDDDRACRPRGAQGCERSGGARRSVRDDAKGVAERLELPHLMAREHQRRSVLAQLFKQFVDSLRVDGIESRKRLVEDQEVGTVCGRARNLDFLLVAL